MLICTGVFLIILSAAYLYVTGRYDIDTRKTVRVLTAAVDIREGMVIEAYMLKYREIKASSVTPLMIGHMDDATGKKAANFIPAGEYLRSSELLPEADWYKDDEKKIVLELQKNNNVSFVLEKGSFIDIKRWSENSGGLPVTVLSRVKVHEILDENGISIEKAVGSRNAYIVLVLDSNQRNRLYAAMTGGGRLFCESYCSILQKPAPEDFVIR